MMYLTKKCVSMNMNKLLRQALRLLYVKWHWKKGAVSSGCTICVLPANDRQPSVAFCGSGSIMAAKRKTQGKSTRGSDGIPSLPLRGVTFRTKRPVMWAVLSGTGRLTGQILSARSTAHVGWGQSRMSHSCTHRKTGTHTRTSIKYLYSKLP